MMFVFVPVEIIGVSLALLTLEGSRFIPSGPWWIPILDVVLPFLLSLAFGWTFAIQTPRRVVMSTETLTLKFGWPDSFDMQGPWQAWRPVAASKLFWMVFFTYLEGNVRYSVPIRQARAILEHPSFPADRCPPAIARALGLHRSLMGSGAG
jgi:hypothetical protein